MVAALGIEHDNGVDEFKTRQHERAIRLFADRTRRPLQTADGRVGIQQNHESVRRFARGKQILRMPAVQQIETSVGKREFFPVRPQFLPPFGGFRKRFDFLYDLLFHQSTFTGMKTVSFNTNLPPPTIRRRSF